MVPYGYLFMALLSISGIMSFMLTTTTLKSPFTQQAEVGNEERCETRYNCQVQLNNKCPVQGSQKGCSIIEHQCTHQAF